MSPTDEQIREQIKKCNGHDKDAAIILASLWELLEARKVLFKIAVGEGYFVHQAREYKQLAKDFFAANK
jgi:hypothetical protein